MYTHRILAKASAIPTEAVARVCGGLIFKVPIIFVLAVPRELILGQNKVEATGNLGLFDAFGPEIDSRCTRKPTRI